MSAFVGFLQYYRWHTFLDTYISVRNAAAVYGNMAQPNHFADYICLGLVSLGLLHSHFFWRWKTVLLAVPLLFVLVLSGSRSAWLYLVCMTTMAGFFREWRFLKYGLSILAGFALMHFIVEISWFSASSGRVTSAGRLFQEASSGSFRLHFWHEAWTIFLNHPILGAGFGQYAWLHFSLGPVLRDRVIVGAYNNAHDIVMQLAAETGLAGLAVLFSAVFFWVRQALGAKPDCYRCWGVTLLAILGIHSTLEYPLWYAHFLGIFAILLGMLDDTFWQPVLRSRLPALAILLLGWLVLFQILSDYRQLEDLLKKKPGESDIAYYERAKSTFRHVSITSPIRPYMELAMSSLIAVNTRNLADKLLLNGAVLHFIPIPQVAYRQARLLAFSGKKDEAESIMAMATWAYPEKNRN
jgi:O-antigen ligase